MFFWLYKKSFFRSLNAIFGKVGRNASEEVILELIRSKCIPILIYGLECFTLTKSDLRSPDFAVNKFLMKIFRSNNSEVIAECRRYFQFNLPSELIEKKKIKFERNYNRCSLLRDMCVCVCSVSETLLADNNQVFDCWWLEWPIWTLLKTVLCSVLTNLHLFKLY